MFDSCVNILHFLMFLCTDFYKDTYETFGSLAIFAVLLSYSEALHAILGFVRSQWILSFVQVKQEFVVVCAN